jgi:predicted DsbA family dithiol-disulfide isomerase
VGLRHLEKAVESLSPDDGIRVHYELEPYLLNAIMREEGEDITEHLAKKYGPSAAARFASHDSPLMQMGRAVGIQFTTKRNAYPTIRAHALMEHIKEQEKSSSDDDANENKANRFMEEMYKSYFEQGANINNVETLAEIAAKAAIGMDKEQIEQACSNEDLLRRVRQKDAEYKNAKGISGVPFFIFHQNNNSNKTPDVGLSGAQPPNVLALQIKKAAAASSSSMSV